MLLQKRRESKGFRSMEWDTVHNQRSRDATDLRAGPRDGNTIKRRALAFLGT